MKRNQLFMSGFSGGRRQLSPQVADVGITASNIISIELLEHEE